MLGHEVILGRDIDDAIVDHAGAGAGTFAGKTQVFVLLLKLNIAYFIGLVAIGNVDHPIIILNGLKIYVAKACNIGVTDHLLLATIQSVVYRNNLLNGGETTSTVILDENKMAQMEGKSITGRPGEAHGGIDAPGGAGA